MHTPHSRPVRVETIHEPSRYARGQIERACAIAQLLDRGKFVLVDAPGARGGGVNGHRDS
jgi:hypothetical protein